jgi:hypothetical protein
MLEASNSDTIRDQMSFGATRIFWFFFCIEAINLKNIMNRIKKRLPLRGQPLCLGYLMMINELLFSGYVFA